MKCPWIWITTGKKETWRPVCPRSRLVRTEQKPRFSTDFSWETKAGGTFRYISKQRAPKIEQYDRTVWPDRIQQVCPTCCETRKRICTKSRSFSIKLRNGTRASLRPRRASEFAEHALRAIRFTREKQNGWSVKTSYRVVHPLRGKEESPWAPQLDYFLKQLATRKSCDSEKQGY